MVDRHVLIALRGMDGKSASSGSCTTASPPCFFTTARPAAPSSSAPVRITPITRRPWNRAADRNSGSIGRAVAVLLVADHREHAVALDDHVPVGGRDVDRPRLEGRRPTPTRSGWRAGSAPARVRICGQDARRAGRDVQDGEDRRVEVGRQPAHELTERLDASR